MLLRWIKKKTKKKEEFTFRLVLKRTCYVLDGKHGNGHQNSSYAFFSLSLIEKFGVLFFIVVVINLKAFRFEAVEKGFLKWKESIERKFEMSLNRNRVQEEDEKTRKRGQNEQIKEETRLWSLRQSWYLSSRTINKNIVIGNLIYTN